MGIVIQDLCAAPQHVPTVARWIYNEFWAGKDRFTVESLEVLLRQATCPRSIPLSLLAVRDGQPAGTVNLIENDDDKRLYLRPWLAALFVPQEHRRLGIGSLLVRSLQSRAASIGIHSLYLGTDNPGFYTRLGATMFEQVRRDFCIMVIQVPH